MAAAAPSSSASTAASAIATGVKNFPSKVITRLGREVQRQPRGLAERLHGVWSRRRLRNALVNLRQTLQKRNVGRHAASAVAYLTTRVCWQLVLRKVARAWGAAVGMTRNCRGIGGIGVGVSEGVLGSGKTVCLPLNVVVCKRLKTPCDDAVQLQRGVRHSSGFRVMIFVKLGETCWDLLMSRSCGSTTACN